MILTVIPTLCFLISMVTLTSININGLNNMAKFDEVLINFKSDILVLQETNWTQACICKSQFIEEATTDRKSVV